MNPNTREWITGLLDINFRSHLLWLSLIPCSCCIIQASAVHKATLGSPIEACILGVCIGIGPAINRTTIRNRYRLKGTFIKDCLISCLFCLAVVQEYKEVEYREKRMKYDLKRTN